MIFCADHGAFLGNHWLGEKELFYDTVQRVPFIVADPRASKNATRGSVHKRFVECVDLVPTVLYALKLPIPTIASRAAACCRYRFGNYPHGATSSTASSITASRARG